MLQIGEIIEKHLMPLRQHKYFVIKYGRNEYYFNEFILF